MKNKLKQQHPEHLHSIYWGGCFGCPYQYGYEQFENSPCNAKDRRVTREDCERCWNREFQS